MQILPDMVKGNVNEVERERRWRQLADIYLAQQVSCYIPDYLTSHVSVDRVLEQIERYEEDLTDRVRVHGELKVIIEVGEAVETASASDHPDRVGSSPRSVRRRAGRRRRGSPA